MRSVIFQPQMSLKKCALYTGKYGIGSSFFVDILKCLSFCLMINLINLINLFFILEQRKKEKEEEEEEKEEDRGKRK